MGAGPGPTGEDMQVFRTGDVPPEGRAAYWSSVYGSNFAPVTVAPLEPQPFRAELRLGRVGGLELAYVRSNASRVERTKQQSDRVSDRYLSFVLMLEGRGQADHCGHESPLSAGDIVLSDNTKPMLCSFSGPVTGLTVRAEEAAVRARMPFIDDVRGVRLPSHVGLTGAVVAAGRCLSQQMSPPMSGEYGAAAASQFLDLVTLSYAMGRGQKSEVDSTAATRAALARQFVETHLADPDLSPDMVAAALKISPRYLRLVMAEEGEPLSALILRRRLEECARQLAGAVSRERSVTDIAYGWGFNSTAHFARVFKTRFGVTPSEYRRERLNGE